MPENTNTHVTKDQFVAVLNEAGVSDDQKKKLHAAFEQMHPDGHDAFLRWLGLSADAVRRIREQSRA